MAFVNYAKMMGNKALNGFNALSRQAKSYYSNPAMLKARSLASQLARSPVTKGGAIAGGILGGAIGSMNYTPIQPGESNRDAALRASRMPFSPMRILKGAATGAVLGGIGGAGYGGYKMMGGMPGVSSMVSKAARSTSNLANRAASWISG